MGQLFENFKLNLYVNICKYLDYAELPYKLVQDVVYIEEDTVSIKLVDKEKYVIMLIGDTIRNANWEVTVDPTMFALPIKSGEDSPFGLSIYNVLNSIRKDREAIKTDIVKTIVKKYQMKEMGEGRYQDGSGKLVLEATSKEIQFTVFFKEGRNTISFNAVKYREETILDYIDEIVELFAILSTI